MPISTDLNVNPYFDDYKDSKDFYKILFRPGVAVQVRELNQLQSILQKQIERFGDNIYKRGTIIDGCNFIFHNPLPYVRINDTETDSTPVNVSMYNGYLAKNSQDLIARIIETSSGFESTFPDLNTLFVKYLNHGSSGNTVSFSPTDTLTIYNAAHIVEDVDIFTKSAGFSNTDIPVFLSAITVQNTSGGQSFVNATGQACTFVVGETITQQFTGAQATIAQVNSTANVDNLVLKIKPLASQLRIGNTDSWTFLEGYGFTSATSKITANLISTIGSGAEGSILTDADGGVTTLIVTKKGSGYYVEPYVSVKYKIPKYNTTDNLINAVDIRAKTYLAKVTVNEAESSIGNGYGMSISEGVIYQKGYFSRVEPSFVVVDKYSTSTNNVVGFDTQEEIVDFKEDFTLLDNSNGTLNENAPGANRLKLTPVLSVLTKEQAEANQSFFSIVEFSEGRPFKQNKFTQFNSITTEMAKRTAEESGDYVLDQFLIKTTGQEDFADEADVVEIAIDPGVAYIDGYRVQTYDNFYKDVRKGTNTSSFETTLSIGYGNYIKVKELGGLFKFSIGGLISLRDAAATYLTSSAGSTITPRGNEIGTARIRSLEFKTGTPGHPDGLYYVYLFDINMNTGKNFKNVKSVYYDGNGSNDGIADIILVGGEATIYDNMSDSLLYSSGSLALKNANNLSYTYRSVNDSSSISTLGQATTSVAANPGEYFAYNTTLTDTQKLTVMLVPLANAICPNSTGQVSITGSATITGSSTTFNTTFKSGDYVRIANSTATEIRRVVSIANATSMTLSNGFSTSHTGANIGLVFPQYVPIPLYLRSDRNVTVTGNTTLTISVGNTLLSPVDAAIYYNAQKNTNSIPKTTTRKAYVKINTATNSKTNKGPWCLGIPDIFRLRNVYLGNASDATVNDTNVTSNFWIDHNQNANYYNVGYLYKKTEYSLSSSVYLLVEFDVFTARQNGFKTVSSYPINDKILLANSDTTINTVEIPEVFIDNDKYFDLRDSFDFRPYCANTVAITTVSTSAPVNPPEPTNSTKFDTTFDKKFPAPQSDCTAVLEKYLGRIDAVVVNSNNDFRVIEGISSASPKTPDIPDHSLIINYLVIPPYPSLPEIKSKGTTEFLNKKISNIKFTNKRQQRYSITLPIDDGGRKYSQPKRYTMKEIGSLERRIADLEYYATLSSIEDKVNNLQIESSTDPTINRFKFGFFVDNFTTTDYSELSDPTYKASIHSYELYPARKQIQIKYKINAKDAETTSCINGQKIILPSTRKQLISQNIATTATTIDVAVTKTTTTATGEIITYSQTQTQTVTKEDYELLTKQVATVKKETVDIAKGKWPRIYATTSWSHEITVGKHAGKITATGGYNEGKVHGPILERYNDTTKQWEIVAGNDNGWGNGITTGHAYVGSDGKSGFKWELTYDYVPNSNFTNRKFRLRQKSYSQNTSLWAAYGWPQTEDIEKTEYTTYYAVDKDTNTSTKYEVLPNKVVRDLDSIPNTVSLFNTRNNALLDIENLFESASALSSPFVDLAAAIQDDLNQIDVPGRI